MITKKQDKVLDIVGVFLPIIFAFLIGVILTAKLFNPGTEFALVDYTIIGVGIFSIVFGTREQIKLRTKEVRNR